MDRTPLFYRLPNIWRALDQQGILERFLSVWDQGFWSEQQKIVGILATRNIDTNPDKFLALDSSSIGNAWRDDKGCQWNRNQIETSTTRASYKGTYLRLRDAVSQDGSTLDEVIDNASKILVLGKQGRLGQSDCHLMNADMWHDGVFQIEIERRGDTDRTLQNIEAIRPAGFKWLVDQKFTVINVTPDNPIFTAYTASMVYSDEYQGHIGFGRLGGNLFVSGKPAIPINHYYHEDVRRYIDYQQTGMGRLGQSSFLSIKPAISTNKSNDIENVYHLMTPNQRLSAGVLGDNLYLTNKPANSTVNTSN